MASIRKRPNGSWRARYRDASGKEHARHFGTKAKAQTWLDTETAKLVSGRWIEPSARKVTVDEWCDTWIAGYKQRPSTVRQAKVHLRLIREEFGPMPLAAVRPSQVRGWLARLHDQGYAASYLHVLHSRFRQVMADAVHDRLITDNPCSRRTSPGAGSQRLRLATTEQVWDLYDAFSERRRLAVLLGAFAGLSTAEACGLRVEDVAFLEREIRPAVQWPAAPLKTEMRYTAIPVADTLLEAISAQVARWPSQWVLTGDDGEQLRPRLIQIEMERARGQVDGLAEGFRFHDLRHYFASLLIASGADVKVVQYRMRHSAASTTLNTYATDGGRAGHVRPACGLSADCRRGRGSLRGAERLYDVVFGGFDYSPPFWT